MSLIQRILDALTATPVPRLVPPPPERRRASQKQDRFVLVRHQGQVKRYRINRYGEVIEEDSG